MFVDNPSGWSESSADSEPSKPQVGGQSASVQGTSHALPDKVAVLETARATRSAANDALKVAARCASAARTLAPRIRSASAFLSRRSTQQLIADAPVVAALAAGHEAMVTVDAAARDATAAATQAADAAMTLELEAESM